MNRDLLALVLRDVLDAHHRHGLLPRVSTPIRTQPCARDAPARAAHFERGARFRRRGQLEHEHALVSDLLQRHQTGIPLDPPLEGQQVIVGAPAVVVHVRRHHVARQRLDRVDQIPRELRVAEVEAHAEVRQLEILLDQAHQLLRGRQPVRDHLERQANAERRGHLLERLDAPARRVRAVVVGPRLLRVGDPDVHDHERRSSDGRA